MESGAGVLRSAARVRRLARLYDGRPRPRNHPMAHGPVLEEPRSPAWLPALGAALFLLVAVVWLTTRPEPKAPAPVVESVPADAGPG